MLGSASSAKSNPDPRPYNFRCRLQVPGDHVYVRTTLGRIASPDTGKSIAYLLVSLLFRNSKIVPAEDIRTYKADDFGQTYGIG